VTIRDDDYNDADDRKMMITMSVLTSLILLTPGVQLLGPAAELLTPVDCLIASSGDDISNPSWTKERSLAGAGLLTVMSTRRRAGIARVAWLSLCRLH
jgi:hypothetical protein